MAASTYIVVLRIFRALVSFRLCLCLCVDIKMIQKILMEAEEIPQVLVQGRRWTHQGKLRIEEVMFNNVPPTLNLEGNPKRPDGS